MQNRDSSETIQFSEKKSQVCRRPVEAAECQAKFS